MNEPQPVSPRRRLQALLEIPDSQRTEAEWDELNELEISLAPGNRAGAPEPGGGRRNASSSSGQPRSGARQPRSASGQPRQRSAEGQPRPEGPTRPEGQPRSADGQPHPGGSAQGKKPPRKFHKRPPKATPPQ